MQLPATTVTCFVLLILGVGPDPSRCSRIPVLPLEEDQFSLTRSLEALPQNVQDGVEQRHARSLPQILTLENAELEAEDLISPALMSLLPRQDSPPEQGRSQGLEVEVATDSDGNIIAQAGGDGVDDSGSTVSFFLNKFNCCNSAIN